MRAVSPYEGVHIRGTEGTPHVLAECSEEFCGRQSPVAKPEEQAFDDAPDGDPETYDLVGKVIAYENGELDEGETLTLFGNLIASGTAWELQGCYGRTAVDLIESGLISPEGIVDWDRCEL